MKLEITDNDINSGEENSISIYIKKKDIGESEDSGEA